jgi:hypothetical protein
MNTDTIELAGAVCAAIGLAVVGAKFLFAWVEQNEQASADFDRCPHREE